MQSRSETPWPTQPSPNHAIIAAINRQHPCRHVKSQSLPWTVAGHHVRTAILCNNIYCTCSACDLGITLVAGCRRIKGQTNLATCVFQGHPTAEAKYVRSRTAPVHSRNLCPCGTSCKGSALPTLGTYDLRRNPRERGFHGRSGSVPWPLSKDS